MSFEGHQEFCLKWDDHQSNMLSVFDHLLASESFVDVTLAGDGFLLKAHKVVLSACSPYFRRLLEDNPCQHPIVILADVRHDEMRAIIEFMYKGEVNVTEERLSNLLKTAETLKIKGLAQGTPDPSFHATRESFCGRRRSRRPSSKHVTSEEEEEDEDDQPMQRVEAKLEVFDDPSVQLGLEGDDDLDVVTSEFVMDSVPCEAQHFFDFPIAYERCRPAGSEEDTLTAPSEAVVSEDECKKSSDFDKKSRDSDENYKCHKRIDRSERDELRLRSLRSRGHRRTGNYGVAVHEKSLDRPSTSSELIRKRPTDNRRRRVLKKKLREVRLARTNLVEASATSGIPQRNTPQDHARDVPDGDNRRPGESQLLLQYLLAPT